MKNSECHSPYYCVYIKIVPEMEDVSKSVAGVTPRSRCQQMRMKGKNNCLSGCQDKYQRLGGEAGHDEKA